MISGTFAVNVTELLIVLTLILILSTAKHIYRLEIAGFPNSYNNFKWSVPSLKSLTSISVNLRVTVS